MNSVSEENPLKFFTGSSADNKAVDVLGLECLLRVGMNREDTSLRGDPPGDMRRDESTNVVDFKWPFVFVDTDMNVVSVGVQQTVAVMLFFHGKEGCDQRISAPIQQSCWQPMVSRDSQPLPITDRPKTEIWQSLFFE